jgi:hypothetical protein
MRREHDATAREEVRVEHRQAVAVVHRKALHCALARIQLQIGGDGLRVGGQIPGRQADQLGTAGGAGRGQEQRELPVQLELARRIGARRDIGLERRGLGAPPFRQREAAGREQERRTVGAGQPRERFGLRLRQAEREAGAQATQVQQNAGRLRIGRKEDQSSPAHRAPEPLGQVLHLLGQRGVGQLDTRPRRDQRRAVAPVSQDLVDHDIMLPSTPITWPVT